ncbi:MAG: hypothetical protein ACXWOV_17160 [Isosphaeraceae bacterium]
MLYVFSLLRARLPAADRADLRCGLSGTRAPVVGVYRFWRDMGYAIQPVVREQAVEGYTESMTPILRPTSLETANNNCAVGLPLHYLFGAIPVGGNR